jgi:dCTP deaminase
MMVLGGEQLQAAVHEGAVRTEDDSASELVGKATISLRVGSVAYRVRAGFTGLNAAISARLPDFVVGERDLRGEGVLLEAHTPYLVPLKEGLSLPSALRASARPNETSLLAGVSVRIAGDGLGGFNELTGGYVGPLWALVVPRLFGIMIREDVSLCELRLTRDGPVAPGWPHAEDSDGSTDQRTADYHRDLHLDLGVETASRAPRVPAANQGEVGEVVDLTRSDWLDWNKHWTPANVDDARSVVVPAGGAVRVFCGEVIQIPHQLAAEVTWLNAHSGDVEVPGFFLAPGYGRDCGAGHSLTAVIHAPDYPVLIEHGQLLGQLRYLPLAP